MKKPTGVHRVREPRAEYDFRGGVRGRYAARMRVGATAVVLDPDVARAYPDAASVNAALRALLRRPRRVTTRRAR